MYSVRTMVLVGARAEDIANDS